MLDWMVIYLRGAHQIPYALSIGNLAATLGEMEIEVNEDRIEASTGLMQSLRLFEYYRRTGILQALIRHFPAYQGACLAQLRLSEGKVISCEIQDSSGQSHPLDLAFISRLDQDKGPFDWKLLPARVTSLSNTSHHARLAGLVPKRIAELNLEPLASWESRYTMALQIVYSCIDGKRTVDEIKASVVLPPHVVEEACRILRLMKVIE